jgi:hypothetical protein
VKNIQARTGHDIGLYNQEEEDHDALGEAEYREYFHVLIGGELEARYLL